MCCSQVVEFKTCVKIHGHTVGRLLLTVTCTAWVSLSREKWRGFSMIDILKIFSQDDDCGPRDCLYAGWRKHRARGLHSFRKPREVCCLPFCSHCNHIFYLGCIRLYDRYNDTLRDNEINGWFLNPSLYLGSLWKSHSFCTGLIIVIYKRMAVLAAPPPYPAA